AGHRYNAVCCAALAVPGKGKDAPRPDKEQARLRTLALDWLRAELAARAKGEEAEDTNVSLRGDRKQGPSERETASGRACQREVIASRACPGFVRKSIACGFALAPPFPSLAPPLGSPALTVSSSRRPFVTSAT